MASSSKHQVPVVIVVIVTVATVLAAPAPALAADLTVGDSQGWSLGLDYRSWVDGNDFFVGDTLVFNYAKGQHSVVQATEASYAACSQANSLAVWTSGDDRVALNRSGPWWFFCGVGDHCQQHGMKFNVMVLPVVKLSTSSSPPAARAHGGGVIAAAGIAAGVAAMAALQF